MIYRQRNKKRSNVVLKVVITIILLLGLLRLLNIQILGSAVDVSLNAILNSKSNVLSPLRNSLVYFKSKEELQRSRDVLLAENTRLKLDSLTSKALSDEYNNFISRFGQFNSSDRVLKVVLKPPFTPFDTIRMSGDFAGYQIGDHVFYQNVIIGTVTSVSNQTGTAELLSASGKVTPAIIKGTQFEARGLGDGRYVIEVAKDFEVTEGEPIIYPQEQAVLLGVVWQIQSLEEELFKKVYFNTPVPTSAISYVTINKPSYEQVQSTD